jgi:16S rRNA (guanine527-N7)-methyltransferase
MGLPRLGSGWEPLVRQVTSALAPTLLVTPQALARLARFLDLVSEWNARVDLTAARSAGELVDLFVADAAVIAAASSEGGEQSWVDVGSGAGAPAIPIAMVLPEVTVALIEPRAKRVAFLRSVQGTLGISNMEVRRGRSEELDAGCFDVALSRATMAPSDWLAEGARIARSGVWVLLARGDAPSLCGWRVDRDVEYRWPLTGVERRALRFVQGPP